ncbi:NADPH:quinone reductase [Thalassoroseus pseudoceratinae]|uniref:NADPH:quinone reductase n=1 Tax=Thalassoroseus pseudoceratinae TaxID=2713176 RepID=UPI001420C810|nr:NADPH:quinone reductase [Thalassoroseus pseudoceratinae]
MKAAFFTETGDPEVIQYADLPDPALGPTEVLVRVAAVAVNPIDTYLRSGAIKLELPSPYVIGCDLAGTVEAVGDEVEMFQVGDRVWGSNQGLMGRQGTFSELASVDEKWLYPIPEGMDEKTAAAGALVGITAHLGLFLHAGLQPGEFVFVNGGTGGVGASVVRLAKASGATVIATVGSEEKKKQCEALGADVVLDYHSSTLDDDIQAAAEKNGGIDIWWETQREPTIERTIGMMKKRGRVVIMAGRDARPDLPIGPFYTNDLKLVGFAMFNATPDEQRVAAEHINRLWLGGHWSASVGQVFPLAEAAAAHRLQEENTLQKSGTLQGKIVLEP